MADFNFYEPNWSGMVTGDISSGESADSIFDNNLNTCLLYTSPSPRDPHLSRMPSSA